MSEFTDRIAKLRREVGKGHLVISVEVDQIYAHYQHEHAEFHHPDGGGANYLRGPLFEQAPEYMAHMADNLFTHDGSNIQGAAQDNAERLSREVYLRAPWEFGDLRASGHPSVTVDGEVVFDRAPNSQRLDDSELRRKSELRYLFDPNRYKR